MNPNPHHPHRRSRTVATLTGAAAALASAGLLAGCGHPAPPASTGVYVGVCVDPVTNLRVPDDLCGGADASTGAALAARYLWDYYPPSYTGMIAAYHQPVVGVTIIHTVPATTSTNVVVIDHGAAARGGSVTSIRAAAVKSHNQATVRSQTTTPATGTTKSATPTTTAPRTSTTTPATRNSSIQRGGLGVPRRAR